MTHHPDHDPHDHAAALTATPVDHLMALVADARTALDALRDGFHAVSCPGHHDDPQAHAHEIGRGLLDTYALDLLDADWLLAAAADTRTEMQRVLLTPPCLHHDHDDQDGDEP